MCDSSIWPRIVGCPQPRPTAHPIRRQTHVFPRPAMPISLALLLIVCLLSEARICRISGWTMCTSTTCLEKCGLNNAVILVMWGRTAASQWRPTSVSVCRMKNSEDLSLRRRLALLVRVSEATMSHHRQQNLPIRNLFFISLTLRLLPTITRMTYTCTVTTTSVIISLL
jgi:hypothetical protein